MKNLYGLFLFGLMGISYASDSYVSEGKIPEGFTFKKCDDKDEDCKNTRQSFMSQFSQFESNDKSNEIRYQVGSNQFVTITSDTQMIATQEMVNGEFHITLKTIGKKA